MRHHRRPRPRLAPGAIRHPADGADRYRDVDLRVGQGGGDPEIGGHIPALSECTLHVTWRHRCAKILPEPCHNSTDGTGHGSDPRPSESPTRYLIDNNRCRCRYTTTVPAVASLAIRNFAFLPSTLTITAGTVVTVTNDDSVAHTWISNTGAFNSGDIAPGSSYKFTFSTPGTHLYHCSIHPFMTGTIVVQ